jgi:hypothetical protein
MPTKIQHSETAVLAHLARRLVRTSEKNSYMASRRWPAGIDTVFVESQAVRPSDGELPICAVLLVGLHYWQQIAWRMATRIA